MLYSCGGVYFFTAKLSRARQPDIKVSILQGDSVPLRLRSQLYSACQGKFQTCCRNLPGGYRLLHSFQYTSELANQRRRYVRAKPFSSLWVSDGCQRDYKYFPSDTRWAQEHYRGTLTTCTYNHCFSIQSGLPVPLFPWGAQETGSDWKCGCLIAVFLCSITIDVQCLSMYPSLNPLYVFNASNSILLWQAYSLLWSWPSSGLSLYPEHQVLGL